MANASRKHMGAGATGKGDGTGAMTTRSEDVRENVVLSNCDKAQHSDRRGQDGKFIQVEQTFDGAANQRSADEGVDDGAG
jgi:hypothetical protein